MKKTLLQTAKEYKINLGQKYFKTITDEQIDVALGWMKDEIRPVQVAVAFGLKLSDGNYQRFLATILREAYRKGKIKII